jgi:PHD/YefM family antitoxin component YafN of YafNO toxin-antitoxin module
MKQFYCQKVEDDKNEIVIKFQNANANIFPENLFNYMNFHNKKQNL